MHWIRREKRSKSSNHQRRSTTKGGNGNGGKKAYAAWEKNGTPSWGDQGEGFGTRIALFEFSESSAFWSSGYGAGGRGDGLWDGGMAGVKGDCLRGLLGVQSKGDRVQPRYLQ